MAKVNKGSLSGFLSTITKGGGMSFTNNFEVSFWFPNNLALDKIERNGITLSDQSTFTGKNGAALTMYCEEASLPGVQATVANTTGRFLGEGAWNYPTQRMYSDLSLTWMCDANMMPLKFLQAWMETVFVDNPTNYRDGLESGFDLNADAAKPINTVTRLNYFDDYRCNFIQIVKGERNQENAIGREAMIYKLYNAYPYSIESTPLSYGSSQVVKVTANFYYQRWGVRHIAQGTK